MSAPTFCLGLFGFVSHRILWVQACWAGAASSHIRCKHAASMQAGCYIFHPGRSEEMAQAAASVQDVAHGKGFKSAALDLLREISPSFLSESEQTILDAAGNDESKRFFSVTALCRIGLRDLQKGHEPSHQSCQCQHQQTVCFDALCQTLRGMKRLDLQCVVLQILWDAWPCFRSFARVCAC